MVQRDWFSAFKKRRVFSRVFSAVGIVLAVFSVIVGLLYIRFLTNKVTNNFEHSLILRAENARLFFEANDILSLKGSESDINSSQYNEIRKELFTLKEVNPDVEFFYLMGKDDDTLFFFADSEPTDSEDYSPPGQVYFEATTAQKQGFSHKKSFVEDVTEDRWGTWVTVFAPIIDQPSGKVVALLGLDIDAKDFKDSVSLAQGGAVVVTVLISLFFLFFSLFIRRMTNMDSKLAIAQSESKEHVTKIKEISKALGNRSFSISVPGHHLTFSLELMHFLEIPSSMSKMDLVTFLMRHIGNKDRLSVEEAIKSIESGSIESTSLPIELVTGSGRQLDVMISLSAKKAIVGNTSLIEGIIFLGGK